MSTFRDRLIDTAGGEIGIVSVSVIRAAEGGALLVNLNPPFCFHARRARCHRRSDPRHCSRTPLSRRPCRRLPHLPNYRRLAVLSRPAFKCVSKKRTISTVDLMRVGIFQALSTRLQTQDGIESCHVSLAARRGSVRAPGTRRRGR